MSIEGLEEYARSMSESGVGVVEWNTGDLLAVFDRLHEAEKPRIITTVDDLKALPVDSVVRERDTGCHFVWIKYEDEVWCIPNDDTSYTSPEIRGPVTVLYEPEAA